jgi:ribokinase
MAERAALVSCIGNITIDESVRGDGPGTVAAGGDAIFAALAARLFVDRVSVVAPVGNDLPPHILDDARAAGIIVEDLPGRDLPTVRNIVTYHDDGSRTWDLLSSDADFDRLSVYPADISESVLASAGIVVSAMSLESQVALTPWLRANSAASLYLDLQEDYLEGNRDEIFELISHCEVFMPSEVEAVHLAGTSDLESAARQFLALGPRTVVIKRAERGSLVCEGTAVTSVPTDAVVPVDSTGAGDSYCGAFAAVHVTTGDAVKAAEAGSKAARIAIGGYGIEGLAAAVRSLTTRQGTKA